MTVNLRRRTDKYLTSLRRVCEANWTLAVECANRGDRLKFAERVIDELVKPRDENPFQRVRLLDEWRGYDK